MATSPLRPLTGPSWSRVGLTWTVRGGLSISSIYVTVSESPLPYQEPPLIPEMRAWLSGAGGIFQPPTPQIVGQRDAETPQFYMGFHWLG